jgi:phosphatidate phosphatase PAH1
MPFWLHCSKRLLSTSTRRAIPLRRSLDAAVTYYEDVIGLSEIQRARHDVVQAEERLSQAQLQRRQKQQELKKIQNRLKDIHSELDRTPRGEDRYLHLITEEHAAIKNEQSLLQQFEQVENTEREAFHWLSNKVSASHEKEREREERTKYWSLTASLVGAILGILGTSIGNELRMRHIRQMIPMSQEVRPVLDELKQQVQKGHEQVGQFVTDVKDILRLDSPKLQPLAVKNVEGEKNLELVVNSVKEQNSLIRQQLDELKRLLSLEQTLNADPNAVVYVGDDMELLLQKTEKNIESKMKLQTLLTVVLAYAVIGVTGPLLYLWLRRDL